ncbi:hypothetical protein RAA17_25375 [Komagataeibacter rhaeticus]|nr:hypothetical protein [Komagataeibacter rhaeticus]
MDNQGMRIEVYYDWERSAHAGACGMFQIESVRNADTGEDLTNKIDVGLHFNGDEPEAVVRYLRKIFGERTTIVNTSEDDDSDYDYK